MGGAFRHPSQIHIAELSNSLLKVQVITLNIDSQSAENTQAIGRALGESAQPGFVYLLSGELGVGKTTLTQGILNGLQSPEQVRSPAFVLATEYSGCLPLYHIDLYRIDSESELLELGLDEYFEGDGVSVVEWADKAADQLPDEHLSIRLEHFDENSRLLHLRATSSGYRDAMDAVRSISLNA